MMSVSLLVAPFLDIILFIRADVIGRKRTMLMMGPLGIIGALCAIIFNDLTMITIGMTFLATFYGCVFGLSFIYLNELLVDPLRSKASGINTMCISFGALSNQFLYLKYVLIKYLWSNLNNY